MVGYKVALCLAAMVVLLPRVRGARPPGTMTLDDLFAKSDIVVLAQVMKVTESSRYHDLNMKYFVEFSVTVRVCGTLKGTIARSTKLVIIAYDFTGNSGPGNFGSTMKLFDNDKRKLHLLYLLKRGNTWMPTSGYVDGGNSHFVAIPSGFVFPPLSKD